MKASSKPKKTVIKAETLINCLCSNFEMNFRLYIQIATVADHKKIPA